LAITGRLGLPRVTTALVAVACALFADICAAKDVLIPPLSTYSKLDPNSVTVSGVSAGGFFAHQFQIAYSGLVKGAGIVAGGPYACANQVDRIEPPFGNPFIVRLVPPRVVASLAVCTHFRASDFQQAGWQFPSKPDANKSREAAMRAHVEGLIDDPANLANSRIWLFHGDKDRGVPKSTVQELRKFYELMGVPVGNIEVDDGPDAYHGMPVKALPSGRSTNHCNAPDPSFLVKCDYGAAELLLRYLYPDASSAAEGLSETGRIAGFNQTEFFDEADQSTSLNETGYLYVPKACENSSESGIKCRLHVAFHGCEQYSARIHNAFVREAGYNAWADASRVIVLYPQAKPWNFWAAPVSGNPEGCFDWWGYSGDDYLGQNGKQMRAVREMIGRLLPGTPQP
jgi:hypothetical protein